MPDYLLQVTLFPATNVLADVSTNTWSCTADDTASAELFKDSVLTFYQSIRTIYSNLIRQNSHGWKIYNRADPEPRAPVAEGQWNFTSAPAGAPMPTEVSLCLSFQGTRASGVPQARRRGRVFLGPLGVGTLENTGRPFPTIITTIGTAASTLRAASIAALAWNWVVWSTVNGSPTTVTNGWIDNEWDTQRRRGRLPATRTVWV